MSPSANGVAAPITTARRSLRTRFTDNNAWIVHTSGAPATRTTGDGIANSTPPPLSGIANFSKFGTKNGICAIS
jgi:hypothetical protein